MAIPLSPRAQALIEEAESFGAHNYAPLPVVLARGDNALVWDVDGHEFIDCLSGYSALNFGHSQRRFLDVAHDQLEKLTLSSRAFYNDQFGPLCRELTQLLGYEATLLMNSGAEAVETALKAARRWGYEQRGIKENEAEIVVMNNNFSGRTISLVSFSTVREYQRGFGPFTPGFKVVPFGDAQALSAVLTRNTVAVLFEPIQGEGGIIIPPDGYLRAMRELTREAGVLMVADEIQTGLGRTGALLACNHETVRPDLVILGKSLGGGVVPISAVVGDWSVLKVFDPGSHGSTFGGNPFACAIAREVVRFIQTEQPHARAARLGAMMLERLRAHPLRHVQEIRGRGMMIGIDIKSSSGSGKDFCKKLMERGILCKDTRAQTLRIAPPLTIEESHLERALDVFIDVLA